MSGGLRNFQKAQIAVADASRLQLNDDPIKQLTALQWAQTFMLMGILECLIDQEEGS